MLNPDPRAYRVALLADSIANEDCAAFDVLGILDAADFGVVVLPPSDFVISTIDRIVEYVVDDLVDYRNNGYRVVIVGSSLLPEFGVWDTYVAAEVDRRTIAPFERFDVAGMDQAAFEAFLGSTVPPAIVRL